MWLAIIGFLLIVGSGANANENIWLMILQFLTGLSLFVPAYFKFIKEVIKNEKAI